MNAPNRNELNGPPLSMTIVTSGSTLPSASREASSRSGRPASRSASARASSTAAMASCWFAVGEMWQPSSYFDQWSRHTARRHVTPEVVSNSVKCSCRTWFGPVGSTASAAFRRAAGWRRSAGSSPPAAALPRGVAAARWPRRPGGRCGGTSPTPSGASTPDAPARAVERRHGLGLEPADPIPVSPSALRSRSGSRMATWWRSRSTPDAVGTTW
jgi:hypothetical protein